VHPEDIAHFAAHEEIERKEAEKEAKFQGVSVEDVLKQHEHDGETIPKPSQAGQVPLGEGAGGVPHPHDDLPSASPVGQKPSAPDYTRAAAADPIAAFRNAKKQSQAQEEWGEGSAGYKAPKTPAEKLRKNVPYKVGRHLSCPSWYLIVSRSLTVQERMQYKFKRSWGDF
jgi:nucleobindin